MKCVVLDLSDSDLQKADCSMTSTREELLKAAMELSETDRLILANHLLDSLPDEVPGLALDDPELATELDRRSGQWEGSISWESLRKELESAK